MMTLADVSLPTDLAFAKAHALVFTPQLADRLAELHRQHGRPDCVPVPTPLTDGRLMLVADILTAIVPGGWLHEMWEAADKAILLPSVEVVPISEVLPLLPPPPEMP